MRMIMPMNTHQPRTSNKASTAADLGAASRGFVRVELDRLLHRGYGRIPPIFLHGDDIPRKHCLPMEARLFRSPRHPVAYFCAMESARLGSHEGHSGDRKIFGSGGNFAMGLCNHRGG